MAVVLKKRAMAEYSQVIQVSISWIRFRGYVKSLFGMINYKITVQI